jgi:hypothetical protein
MLALAVGFGHWTSGEGDSLHTHLVIANRIKGRTAASTACSTTPARISS